MSDVLDWPHLFREGNDIGPVALTLHGTGGSEHDSVQLADLLLPGQPVVSPRGQVSEQGMNRWFARASEGVFDVDDVIFRAGELAALLPQLLNHYGLTGRPLVALGFSNGANIGQALALLHPEVVNTVVAFSGMYPFGDRDPVGDVTGVKIFSAGGESDPMAPNASATHLVEVARQHGADITRVVRPGGHGISQQDVDQAAAWLASVL
jgi:phospholipase/carboxylesterase